MGSRPRHLHSFALAVLLGVGAPAPPAVAQEAEPQTQIETTAQAESDVPSRRPRRRLGRPRADTQPPVVDLVPNDIVAVPDRWSIIEALGVHDNWLDPYNQNSLKADRPIFGKDWFINLRAVSDTIAEFRRIPTPVGLQSNRRGGRIDAFGKGEQMTLVEQLIMSVSLIKGDTVFRPPDWEFRFTGVQNWNYTIVETDGAVKADPSRGHRRDDKHFGVQEFFVDYHIRNVSERYDFDNIRFGVQPFISDFRGFLFQDQQLGLRLFGTRDNNIFQYNLAFFQRLEKDTNSGLNDWFHLRRDYIFFANLFWQDLPSLGHQMQFSFTWNGNHEKNDTHFNKNDFIQRPASIGIEKGHDYDAFYFGVSGDGHFDRINSTFSLYYVTGTDSRNPIANRHQTLNAWFFAGEASRDFDWYRLKAYFLYASGDRDTFDKRAEGFDAIFENPQFAGFDTSFFQRQSVPFIGGGGVILSGRNALIPSLRASKEEGQSNFVNPGLVMAGVGGDFDVLPELRLIANASWLEFDNTSSLRTLRNQGRIDNNIGWDVSAGLIYRPWFIQNVVFRLSAAVLFPGKGFRELFDDREKDNFYSVLGNLILTY